MNDTQNSWLEEILRKIPSGRVTVFGDFCLDAYWLIDSDDSELSVETGLVVRRVKEQHYSLGGAGNVVANLADIGVGEVRAVGLIGKDLFGRQMLDILQELGVNTEGMLSCQDDWQTFVYSKPYIGEDEQNRIDFGPFNRVNPRSIEALADQLAEAAKVSDVVILNQQIPAGLSEAPMIERINEVIASHGACKFIVDSRHRGELYSGAILKVNSHEASRLCGRERPLDERVSFEESCGFAGQLGEGSGQAVFVTRGTNGMVVADQDAVESVPGIQIIERTDPVGAGDTVVAALAAALAVGANSLTAARLANIAASVTVRKIKITGTASPDEIRAVGPTPEYVYLPELADDPRQAKYIEGSEIEIIRELPKKLEIKHAIFDHDGTISTLRQGWEKIMEPMMVRAILGPRFEDADESLYHKVVDRSRIFIDKTTGIQTLKQMEGLIELVKEFGCVAEGEILDMHGYKAIYNEALLDMVRERIVKLQRGELSPEDYQMKNAQKLLAHLHARGVKLYLASGTDQQDVIDEAMALGYGYLFEGRIFGAVGDVKVEAKRIVLDRIIGEHGLSGPEFVTFGDGPVEMRETHKRGGITVGVASDEVRRFGLNNAKRTRLIRAGADLIVPDFTQLDSLLGLLSLDGS
ncbi:MAG: PfkB family carbohydrate kinase [Planctomycetota bacterium]|jgi:rfaE bifunctional protein kinase chain/domain